MEQLPLVSCIMPTYNRRRFVPQAVRYFLRQDYPNRELIIVDDGTDAIMDLVPDDPRIRYVRLNQKKTIGAKRNFACQEAKGEVIVHWDDDDWMADWRLRYQVDSLLRERADLCGLAQVLYYAPQSEQAWQYRYPTSEKPWVTGNTLCYTKAFWTQNPFVDVNVGEDTRFVWTNRSKKIVALQDSTFYVALIHPGNISPKRTTDTRWHPYPIAEIQHLMGKDWGFYNDLFQDRQTHDPPDPSDPARHNPSAMQNSHNGVPDILPRSQSISAATRQLNSATSALRPSQDRPVALVSAGSGIGDILRITPLIRVFAQLGYLVDVLLAPDYPEVAALLNGAPEVRRLFYIPSAKAGERQHHLEGLDQEVYDIAAFTIWGLPLQRYVRARRTLAFEQAQWLREGDIACVEKIAKAVGWEDALPGPFAMPSQRRFHLAPNTVALHPGCKPDWPWKKWHGFEELARLLPEVVLIGTAADVQNEQTYFRQAFTWPEHAQNFVGTLSLPDTAALLRECTALVSNDSGLMQLGVAMGIPTFGIFGITNPQREAIPAEHMFPISKGLPCEPACRQMPWGQRDCEHHLECLKSLTAQEVFDKMRAHVPQVGQHAVASPSKCKTMDDISVAYYGYVFDASGYGHAARAYIHALHQAGISLSVVDLTNHPRQVRDELVESLTQREIAPDFHLFHGIPPQWARLAFRLPNAIGMTVWETDSMPSQWRNVLSHVLEVWLPCAFNMDVFSRGLETPVFKLPHPLFRQQFNGNVPDSQQFLPVTEREFVFYSIFEWQDRKCPVGVIESYLRAFPTDNGTLLIIKTNPSAERIAHQVLEKARQQVPSGARVVIRAEAWSEAEIEALHARGDCYVSLHRGEGWGYPLFEAASRGVPVIATGYSGPLDYLNPQDHQLVRYELTQARQSYVYYHPHMRWAQPDLTHAAELMRSVYEHRQVAKERAAKAAAQLQSDYSLEAVGALARERLIQLLKRTQSQKWQRLGSGEYRSRLQPPIPIPAEWYDQDYFETGLKSNWNQGYRWPLFVGIFREAAAFLISIFSEAQSYLDIGCAKGFLVRTLREAGKECWGFDHSRWAIEHADARAQPFVTLASIDDVSFDRQFDLLVAFEIFQQLTESQIESFLSRARTWTRIGIVAIISSFENEAEERRHHFTQDNADLAQITMHSRDWWHELFLKAGWRQDPLHRVVEHICQAHVLPRKMGWKVYVYAPGQ